MDEPEQGLAKRFGDALARAIMADEHATLVIGADGRSVLFAQPMAAHQLGQPHAAALMAQGLPESAPGVQRFRALLASPDPATTSLERLRFFVGFRGVMRVALCRRIEAYSGERALLVVFSDEEMARRGMPPSLLAAEAEAKAPAPAALAEPIVSLPVVPEDSSPQIEVVEEAFPWLEEPAELRRPRRFLFELDANGIIQHVSPPLRQVVGGESAAIVGRALADVAADFDEAAGETIAQAIQTGETFTGIAVPWRVDGNRAIVPVEWSALPRLSDAAQLMGFSGFGRCRLDQAIPLSVPDPEPMPEPLLEAPETHDAPEASAELGEASPAEPDRVEAPPDDANEEEPASLAPDDLPNEVMEPSALEAEPVPQSVSLPQSEPPSRPDAQPEPANVVSLRTGQPAQALPGFQRGGLSNSERNAFREIARALGARFEDEPEGDPDVAPTLPAKPALAAADAPAAADSAGPASQNVSSGHDPLLDRLPIGLMILRGSQPLYANRTLLDLTDYPDFTTFEMENGAEAIFRKGVMPKPDRPALDAIVLSTREGEMIPVDAHLQKIEWQGETATLISFRRAVELEQGKALRSVALDLKRARADLTELRAILDTATDGVIVLDEKGGMLSLNGAAQALFGVHENELVGESFTQLLHRDSHAEALDYLEAMKSAGLRSVLNDGREVWGREKKGGRIPLFMTLGRISEEDPSRFCAVLRDMTAWKRAEAGLTEARQAAEFANAKKSDFLAKISHEIRTPMNAIMGFADLMQEERLGPLGNPKYKEYLGDIRTSGQHVVSLVNDLLDLAKIEAGRMELSFVATDLNAIVASTVALIQPQATQNRVLVRLQLAQSLPPVVADERSIRQIVLNMLSNATRFTEAGGQVIVSTSLLATGEVVIRIRDTGIGMTTTEIEQALEPFRQVGRDRTRGGTGLGLPLTKALVEANRASFGISSKPGEGTLIEITFPATRVLAE
jgi:PAS domain S-box-containing protein